MFLKVRDLGGKVVGDSLPLFCTLISSDLALSAAFEAARSGTAMVALRAGQTKHKKPLYQLSIFIIAIVILRLCRPMPFISNL